MTGIDEQGKSCVLETHDATVIPVEDAISLADAPFEIAVDSLSSRPPGHGELLDLQVKPGSVQWSILEFVPNGYHPMHHTNTFDLDIVIDGTLELILDDGVHELAAGDCVVMTGIDHAWRAGPGGCRLNVIAIGTPPPA